MVVLSIKVSSMRTPEERTFSILLTFNAKTNTPFFYVSYVTPDEKRLSEDIDSYPEALNFLMNAVHEYVGFKNMCNNEPAYTCSKTYKRKGFRQKVDVKN